MIRTETAVEEHFLFLEVSIEPGQHPAVRTERPGVQQQACMYVCIVCINMC